MSTNFCTAESSADRREFQRYTFAVPAIIEVLSARGRKKFSLQTANISSGGVFLSTNRLLPEGTQTRIVIFFPFDELRNLDDSAGLVVMNVMGRVQRSESAGIALEFNRDYKLESY